MACASEPDGLAAGAGALPGARRRCEAGTRTHGPGPRACLALLAAAALLALAAPAQAQVVIWSATLTPQLVNSPGGGFGDDIGCDNASSNTAAACSETSVLSDDDFTYNSTTYVIRQFSSRVLGISAAFDSALTDTDNLYFRVNAHPSFISSRRYARIENTSRESGASFRWSVGNTNPWRVDSDVSLAILHLIHPP